MNWLRQLFNRRRPANPIEGDRQTKVDILPIYPKFAFVLTDDSGELYLSRTTPDGLRWLYAGISADDAMSLNGIYKDCKLPGGSEFRVQDFSDICEFAKANKMVGVAMFNNGVLTETWVR